MYEEMRFRPLSVISLKHETQTYMAIYDLRQIMIYTGFRDLTK